jgi:hypothetical protein
VRGLLVALLLLASIAGADTRGMRNKNYGNVAIPASGRLDVWPGCVGFDDAGYMVFRHRIDGLRAVVINLKAYHRRYGICQVEKIVARWTNITDSPAQKRAYTKFICNRIGVWPREKLDMNDPRVLRGLTEAIIYYENGCDAGLPSRMYDRVFPTTARP